MGHMIIDGRKVEFTDEKNVLSVIRKAGINIPTLCYHSELSTFGACRLCTVEDDRGRTFASCSEEPRDGMVIYTNSGKIKKYRKLIVERHKKVWGEDYKKISSYQDTKRLEKFYARTRRNKTKNLLARAATELLSYGPSETADEINRHIDSMR